jgi:hypothetical protein
MLVICFLGTFLESISALHFLSYGDEVMQCILGWSQHKELQDVHHLSLHLILKKILFKITAFSTWKSQVRDMLPDCFGYQGWGGGSWGWRNNSKTAMWPVHSRVWSHLINWCPNMCCGLVAFLWLRDILLLCFLFLGPLFSVLSFILWNSLWLVEEVLTLLCFFLIVRMEISQLLWEIFLWLRNMANTGHSNWWSCSSGRSAPA